MAIPAADDRGPLHLPQEVTEMLTASDRLDPKWR